MTFNPKKLQSVRSEAGNLTFPNAANSVQRDDQARHDALLAHDLLDVIRQLVEAVQADGALPDGYCFCPENRDAKKFVHVGECCDLRAALRAAAPFLVAA